MKPDDSVNEEEKDQVGLAFSGFFTLPCFGPLGGNCDFTFGLSKWTWSN